MKVMEKNKNDLIKVIIITAIFFILFNIFFQLTYEEIDDFIIMNLISKADGTYSMYGIYIHPILCLLIILLFKTGINVNFYTIVLLLIQFVSFVTIGNILVKKHKKVGYVYYSMILLVLYSQMLLYIQYTSTASLAVIAGILSIIYGEEKKNIINKYFVFGNILIIIGAMLRFNSCLLVMPFLIVYYIIKNIQEKSIETIKKSVKSIIAIFSFILIVYISNSVIYNLNSTCKQYMEFNNLRSYLHDVNRIDYLDYSDELSKMGWTSNDITVFYDYFFGDENVYNTENLKEIVEVVKSNQKTNILDKLKNTTTELLTEIKTTHKVMLFALLIITFIIGMYKNDKHKYLVLTIFILTILMHIGFIYIGRSVYRIVIPLYIAGISLIAYFSQEITVKNKYNKVIIYVFLNVFIIIVLINLYNQKINTKQFNSQRDVIEYVNSNKENVYFYSTISLGNRYLAYSVYEKIPDNTFSNLAPIAEWTTYTENYYELKERYNLDNIIEDLYKKDNVYTIMIKKYSEQHLNILKDYINNHYNDIIEWDLVKDFQSIQIYKLRKAD